ncbi:MAG: TolC family outer membrane protein [Neomegalonema sp.]|nr:TolC family outer membrane protein [Neomegalonema sp.]
MKRFAQAALCCAALVAGAGSAAAETFRGALEAALKNSPTVLAQREVLRTLDEAVAAARAGMRPTVAATASIGATKSHGPTGETDTTPTSVGVTASQPLFDGFQTDHAIAAADASVEAGRFTLHAVEQSVLLAAVEAYVNVIKAQQNLRLARNNVAVIAKQLEATRARLSVGEVTRTDVAQAEARLAESRANLRSREGDLRSAAKEYERVVGVPPRKLARLPALPVLPKTLKEAEAIALKRNPTYLAALSAEKSAAFTVDRAKGALLPQVSLSSSATVSSTDAFGSGPHAGTVAGSATVTVTVPIYSAGTLRSTIRSSAAVKRQRAHERDEARRQLLRDLGVNWESLKTARATITANIEQVEAQRIAYRGVREEARVGSRTTLDVLDAEQALLDARIALVTARADRQIAAYRVLAQLGLLTIETLGLKVKRYDPKKPYKDSQKVYADHPRDKDDKEWMKRY